MRRYFVSCSDDGKLIARPPSNINMDDLRRDAACKPNSLEQPTYGTYLLLRYKLGVIVARVC